MEEVAVCTEPSPAKIDNIVKSAENRLWDGPALLRLWHLASLDAATVALVWSLAFTWAAHIRLAWWSTTVLVLIAWAVYVGDRLLDARAGMQSPPLHLLRERHFFHWRHRRILAPAALAAAAVAACLVLIRLPAASRMPDSAVAVATLAYFSGVHSRFRVWSLVERMVAPLSPRALLIGVLFTAGCLLPAASQSSPGTILSESRIAVAAYFVQLGWLNCDAIGRWESREAANIRASVILRALLVAGTGAVLVLLLAAHAPRLASLAGAGAVSALLFVFLELKRPRLAPVALRSSADLVMLTPALLFLMGR